MSVKTEEGNNTERERLESQEYKDRLEQKIRDQAKRLLQCQTYINICEKFISILKPDQVFPVRESDLSIDLEGTKRQNPTQGNEDMEKVKEKYSLLVKKYKQLTVENERLLETINMNTARQENSFSNNPKKKNESFKGTTRCEKEKCSHQTDSENYRKELIISQVLISELRQELDSLKNQVTQNNEEPQVKEQKVDLLENLNKIRQENNKIMNNYIKLEKTKIRLEDENRRLSAKIAELESSNERKLRSRESSEEKYGTKKSVEFKGNKSFSNAYQSNGFKEKVPNELENEIVLLKKLVHEKDRVIASYDERLNASSLEEENHKLKAELDKLKSDRPIMITDELNKTLRIIEKQTEDMRVENSNVNSMLTNELKLKSKELEICLKDVTDLKKALAEKNSEIETLNNRVLVQEYEIKVKNEKEQKFFQKKYETMVKEKEELVMDNINKNYKLTELQERLDSTLKQLKNCEDLLNELEQIKSKQLELSELKDKNGQLTTKLGELEKEIATLKDSAKGQEEELDILKTSNKQLREENSDNNTFIYETKLGFYSSFSVIKFCLQKLSDMIKEDNQQVFSEDIEETTSKYLDQPQVLPNEINPNDQIKSLEFIIRSLITEIENLFTKIKETPVVVEQSNTTTFFNKLKPSGLETGLNEKRLKDQIKQLQEENSKLRKDISDHQIKSEENLTQLTNLIKKEKNVYYEELEKISVEFQELNEINTELSRESKEKGLALEQLRVEVDCLEMKNSILSDQYSFYTKLISKISSKLFDAKEAKYLNALSSVNDEKMQFEIEKANITVRIKQINKTMTQSSTFDKLHNHLSNELETLKSNVKSYSRKIEEFQSLISRYSKDLFRKKETPHQTIVSNISHRSNMKGNHSFSNLSEFPSETGSNSLYDGEVIERPELNRTKQLSRRNLRSEYLK